jgi:protein AATF/BFR2
LDDREHSFAFRARRRGKEAKKLQGDIVMEGKEYAGRRATRRSVFAQFEDNPVFSPQAGDADGSGSGSDSEGGSEGEDGSVDDDELQANGGGAASCDEDGPGGSSSDGRSGSESDGGGAASGGEEDDEMAALEREYESMAAAEVEASAGLRERAAKELRKARAVAAQRRVWQRALEARILLQRALAGAHRLPRGEGHAAVGAVDESLAGGLRGLAGDAAGLLGDLLGLLGALGDQNPALAAGQKRKREPAASPADDAPASERLWAALDESYRGFAPFRDASVDRWHRKTALAAGGGARGLKALNQSVSAQVGMVMADAGRVVERTRLPRRQCAVLCALEEEAKQVSVSALMWLWLRGWMVAGEREGGGCRVFHLRSRNLEMCARAGLAAIKGRPCCLRGHTGRLWGSDRPRPTTRAGPPSTACCAA